MFQHYSRKGEMDAWVTCKEPLIQVSFERVLVMLHLFLCIMGKAFQPGKLFMFSHEVNQFQFLAEKLFFFWSPNMYTLPIEQTSFLHV